MAPHLLHVLSGSAVLGSCPSALLRFLLSVGHILNSEFLNQLQQKNSVCGSGMFIPDPDFPDPGFWIPDQKTSTKEWGEKIVCHTFFYSHKFHKI